VCALVSTGTQLRVTLQHIISVSNITKSPHIICMTIGELTRCGSRRCLQQIVARTNSPETLKHAIACDNNRYYTQCIMLVIKQR